MGAVRARKEKILFEVSGPGLSCREDRDEGVLEEDVEELEQTLSESETSDSLAELDSELSTLSGASLEPCIGCRVYVKSIILQ